MREQWSLGYDENMKLSVLLLSLVVAVFTGACSHSPAVAEREQFFVLEVKPILERNCLRCHNGTTLPGQLDLRTGDQVLTQSRQGQRYVVPHHPEQSLLVTAISRNGAHPKLMPRLDTSLTDDQIGVLTEWITDGAAWPTGNAGRLHPVANPENP